jgi:hypothetical protein
MFNFRNLFFIKQSSNEMYPDKIYKNVQIFFLRFVIIQPDETSFLNAVTASASDSTRKTIVLKK